MVHIKYPLLLRKEACFNIFKDTLNTFYLRLTVVGYLVKEHTDNKRGNPLLGEIYPLYLPSHRQDSTYHGLWYAGRVSLSGTRNSRMIPP